MPELPISISWREWIADRKSTRGCLTQFDAIVVGSGYGGSVATLRLAEKGYRVLLLERGGEYLPGDFPNDFASLPKALRANIPGRPLPMGPASGLFEVSVGQGIAAVTGNGLGGGSLINAGVVIRPDADVFTQDAWPMAIRHGAPLDEGRGDLERAFSMAHDGLGARDYQMPAGGAPLKAQALQRAADELSSKGIFIEAKTARLTHDPGKCLQCGECASGCNVPGAKGDLRSTYLAKAVQTCRVQIVTHAEVYRFERVGLAHDRHWRLRVFATDAQQQKLSRQEVGDAGDLDRDPASTLRTLRTRLLILSAGTLGSTQLLQRSQALAGEQLAFSPALGSRLSGNGDSLSVHVDPSHRVNAVGYGSNPKRWEWKPLDATHHPHIVGPTITSMLDLRDTDKPLTQRVLLQDGAIPGALSRVFQELLATTQTLEQLEHWRYRPAPARGHGHEPRDPGDPLAASPEAAARAQVWLAMGHDGSPGHMLWMPGTDSSAMVMPDPGNLETYRAQQDLFDQLKGGGMHLHNPLWQLLPPTANATMSGERPPRWLTTVHPLGGCPMGDDPKTSVVNHLGQVWVHDPAAPERHIGAFPDPARPSAPCVYPGLYVLDGSIVPTSLGCNPLLTITALTERALLLADLPHLAREPRAPCLSERRKNRAPLRTPPKFDAVLRETLRASAPLQGRWARLRPDRDLKVRLDAELASDDLEATLAQQRHRFSIPRARLDLGWCPPNASGDVLPKPPENTRTYLREPPGDGDAQTESNEAWFDFLPAHPRASHGWLPAICAFAETVIWLLIALSGPVLLGILLCQGAALQALIALALAVLGTAAWGVLAITPRTVLTWLILRGWFDVADGGVRNLAAGFRAMVHARERRQMDYRLPLQLAAESGPASDDFPQRVLLTATKTVMYRATPGQLLRWVWRQLRRRLSGSQAEIPPVRPSYWEQLMDAQVSVVAHAPGHDLPRLPRKLLACEMKMGFDSLFSERAAQLGRRGDTTTGLLVLAGYALLAARFAIKTRLYDFRLPNYSNRPAPDQAGQNDLALRAAVPDGRIEPECHVVNVPRGTSSGDLGDEPTENVPLRLYRYPRLDAQGKPTAPSFTPAKQAGVDVARAQSVLLLHAFGQSGLSYTFKAANSPPGSNLAEAFYAAGYEVWVLDGRMSTRSGHAERSSNVDMQAMHDVPRVINYIRSRLSQHKDQAARGRLVQVAVFAQCIGSAALWMTLLSGRLAGRSRPSALWAAMFSQVHALTRGTPVTRAKTWVPAQLRHLMSHVPFGVRGPQSGLWQAMDRLLASMPVPEAERQLVKDEDGLASCRRIRFIEAPLFRHENMDPDTLAQMNRLFGAANLRLFAHARRFVEHRRLVDEDGVNRYVIDSNLRKSLNLPVQLLHGQANELFDVRGALDTFDWLRQQHPSCVRVAEKPLIIPGYGHLDVLLGRNAHRDVFPHVLGFFKAALADPPAPLTLPPATWQVQAPRVGPMLGWVRNAGGTPAARIAFIVDDLHGGAPTDASATQVVVRIFDPVEGQYVRLKTHRGPEDVYRPRSSSRTPQELAYRTVWVDVQLTMDRWRAVGAGQRDVKFQALTVHRMGGPAHAAPPALTNDEITRQLAEDARRVKQHNAEARFDGRAPRRALLDAVAFSVPAATWRALNGDPSQAVEFIAGCCRHPGLTVDQDRIDDGITTALEQAKPVFALLVGDQIYADATAGLADPASPLERYVERHQTAFTSPRMRRLLSQVPTFMTPDDHEWVDNFPLASPLLKWLWPDWRPGSAFHKEQKQRRQWANNAITSFQRLQTTRKASRYARLGPFGPVRIFIIDSRFSRRRDAPLIVKNETLNELKRWLENGPDAQLNVVVCGSVVLPGLYRDADPAAPGPIDTWQHAPTQRQTLLDLLVGHSLRHGRRFLLVSGDYHVSTALQVHAGDQAVGAAVVVPPIYAPLPYANTAPEHLNLNEPLQAAGVPLRLHVPDNGEPRCGSGMARVTVQRQDDNRFEIRVTRDLRHFEAGIDTTPPDRQVAVLRV